MDTTRRFPVDIYVRYSLVHMGLDEKEVLQAASLPLDLFEQSSAFLDSQQFSRFWEALIRLDKHPTPLPLRILELPLFGEMGAHVMVALCSPNFQVCTKRIQKYKPLIGPLQSIIKESNSEFSIEFEPSEKDIRLHPSIFVADLIFSVALMRHGTGLPIVPISIESAVPLEHPGYAEYFGCDDIKLTNRYCTTFSLQDSLRPFNLKNDKTWEFFEPEYRKRLEELEVDASFSAAVRSVLMESLPLGITSAEKIAEKLCVSQRTLQRRLKREDTSFQEQLNHCRHMLAKHYLLNSKMSITEIAFMIGYMDSSSFSRSFAIWTGLSPEKYRISKKQS